MADYGVVEQLTTVQTWLYQEICLSHEDYDDIILFTRLKTSEQAFSGMFTCHLRWINPDPWAPDVDKTSAITLHSNIWDSIHHSNTFCKSSDGMESINITTNYIFIIT